MSWAKMPELSLWSGQIGGEISRNVCGLTNWLLNDRYGFLYRYCLETCFR